MYTDAYLAKFVLPEDLMQTLKNSNCLCYPETKEQLIEMCYGPTHTSKFDVCYSIDGKGLVKEAEVVRCKNGASVNFVEDYMRPPISRALPTFTAISSPSSARRPWNGSAPSAL